jgi:uncharacterized pyridoxamine 5'-phosphate oxidase family protein
MKLGNIYFNFDQLKKKCNLPDDALLKNIFVYDDTGEFEIYFYTNAEGKFVDLTNYKHTDSIRMRRNVVFEDEE